LDLAERLISSLDDIDLVKRYFEYKDTVSKVNASLPHSTSFRLDRAYKYYKSISLGNQKLK
jgi:hypothetical protein